MGDARRRARASSMPSRMPMPARRIGAKTSFLPAMIGACIVVSGVSISISLERQVARDLVAEQHADLVEQLAEALGRALLVAHQRQLVLHQRMVDDGDAVHGRPSARGPRSATARSSRAQNTVPSLTTVKRRRAVRALLARDARGRRPRCRLRAPWRAETASASSPSASRTSGAIVVEQRDRQRAPLDDELGVDRVRPRRPRPGPCSAQHAGVDEQPAIAIFGKPGEPVDVGHARCRPTAAARSANRSATARACGTARGRPSRRRARSAGCRQVSPRATPPSVRRPGQIGPRCSSSAREDRRRPAAMPSSACAARWSNRPPGRGRQPAEDVRVGQRPLAEPAQQRGAAFEPDQRIVRR